MGPSIIFLTSGGYADKLGLIPRSNTRRLGFGSSLEECSIKKQSAGKVIEMPGTLLSAMKRDSGAARRPPSRADMLQNCWFSRAGGSSGIVTSSRSNGAAENSWISHDTGIMLCMRCPIVR